MGSILFWRYTSSKTTQLNHSPMQMPISTWMLFVLLDLTYVYKRVQQTLAPIYIGCIVCRSRSSQHCLTPVSEFPVCTAHTEQPTVGTNPSRRAAHCRPKNSPTTPRRSHWASAKISPAINTEGMSTWQKDVLLGCTLVDTVMQCIVNYELPSHWKPVACDQTFMYKYI